MEINENLNKEEKTQEKVRCTATLILEILLNWKQKKNSKDLIKQLVVSVLLQTQVNGKQFLFSKFLNGGGSADDWTWSKFHGGCILLWTFSISWKLWL